MTESQWQSCTDPDVMLTFLRAEASDRKLRLFACACKRRIWELLDDNARRTAEALERSLENPSRGSAWLGAQAEASAVASAASAAARARFGEAATRTAWDEQRRAQCALLRDIFPFREPRVDPAWLQANGGAVAKLAREIYERQTFDRLPELAEALMDADCMDDRLLAHCHSGKGHVRGCWVIDALLGQE